MRAVQTDTISAAVLDSMAVFVLFTPTRIFKWIGAGATEESRSTGDHVAQHMGGDRCGVRMHEPLGEDVTLLNTLAFSFREVVVLDEGNESDEFWCELGGRTEYTTTTGRPYGWPRLFQISEATGIVRANEVHNYTQEDLHELDVFLLDGYKEVRDERERVPHLRPLPSADLGLMTLP